MEPWTLRRAKQSDCDALSACIDAAYAIYAGKGIELPAVAEGISEDIRDNVVWVAILNKRVVGGIVLIPGEGQAKLANIAVHPEATGMGLGRALIGQAEREASERGLKKLTLRTHVDIPENVRLYQHLGWSEIDRTDNTVLMEKRLAGRG